MIKKLYKTIFGEEITEGMKNFIRNLSGVSFFYFFSKFFSIPFQILAGRFLGAYEYGKFSYIVSLSYILYVFLSFGVSTTLAKHLSEAKNKKEITSTATIQYFCLSIFVAFILLILSEKLSLFLKIDKKYIIASLIFGYLLFIKNFMRSFLQGIHQYTKVGMIETLFWFFALISFLFFFNFKKNVYSAIYAYILGHIVGYFVPIRYFLNYFSFKYYSKNIGKKMFSYSLYVLLTGISAMFIGNIDRILLNKYTNLSNVGVFQAYFFATIGISNFLGSIFGIVYFPEISKRDKITILHKVNKTAKFLPILLLPFSLISYIIIYLYNYGFNPLMYLIMLLSTLFSIYHLLYINFLASLGRKGVKKQFYIITLSSILNIILNVILIPKIGIIAPAIAFMFTYFLSSMLSYVYSKKLTF